MNCQQSELYAAEAGIDWGKRFESLHHTQAFVDGLRDTWWWEKWLGEQLQRVEVGPTRRGASGSVGWYVPTAKAGRMEFVTCRPPLDLVVHELAHVVAACRRNSKSHDPWFARIYLELAYLIAGREAYEDLAIRFLSHGIDFDAGGITDWTR
jgi:hypothetical protein